MSRRHSIRDWAYRLRRHSFAWVSSLLLHVLIFLLVLWWGAVAFVPGQGAVEVWLVGGASGGGGASGSEAGRRAASRSGEVPRVNSESTIRPREGSHSSRALVRPPVPARISPRASQPETVTKAPEPVPTVLEKPKVGKHAPIPASAPPSTVVTEPHPAQMELERPMSLISSLLAKAVPTAVPRVPFQEISGGESPNPSTQAEERRRLAESAGKDSREPESKKGGDGLPAGEERPESEGEGTSDSGSDSGAGDGKGFWGTMGGGSWVGRGGGTGRGGGDWRVLLLRRIEGAKRYPARARRLEMEGVTEVQFRITRDGTVEGVTVVKSSGFPLLDRASVETIKRAAPFPPIPGTIRVPISYRLRDTR